MRPHSNVLLQISSATNHGLTKETKLALQLFNHSYHHIRAQQYPKKAMHPELTSCSTQGTPDSTVYRHK